ncbi:MAG: hypothetical protein P4L50_20425 [Anaerolineaceae bacterium]|nr:hypothetical protein [Anaerolineaceae bacterium]
MFTKEEIIRKLSESPTRFVYEFIFLDEPYGYKYYLINNNGMSEIRDEKWRATISSKITELIDGNDQNNKQVLIDDLINISASEEFWKQQAAASPLNIEEEVSKLAPFGLVRLGKLIEIIEL